MRKTYIFLFLLIDTLCMFGQGPYWLYDSHYLTDKYIINPAFAGSQYYPKTFIGTQRMEMQMSDAPAVHLVGAHSRLGIRKNYTNKYRFNDRQARNAIGGLMFADINGPFQAIGIKLDYAYSVPLSGEFTLSFGLGGMLFSKKLRLDNYNSPTYDPLIAESMGNKVIIPDFNAGIVLSRNQFYAGFSAAQLFENSFQFSKYSYAPAQVYRNYFLLTGYRFVYDRFELEPSFVAGHNFAPKSHANSGNYVDINVEFFVKPIVILLSYRINGFITTSFLYRAEKLEFGIRLEQFSTNSSNAPFNSIGFMISYTFLPSDKR